MYRSIALVAVVIAAMWIGINCLLLAVTGQSPAWLTQSQSAAPPDQVEEVEQHVAGLIAAGAARDTTPPELFFLGMSTAREGLDPKVLERDAGVRAAGFTGSGAGFDRLLGIATPIVESSLRPKFVLLGIHVGWLVGRTSSDSVSSSGKKRSGNSPSGSVGVRERLASDNWLSRNRALVGQSARAAMHDLRLRLGLIAPQRSPWSPPKRLGYPQHSDSAFLANQWSGLRGYGWFDSAAYAQRAPQGAQFLADVIQAFCRRGSNVGVVLMPEKAALRAAIPSFGIQYLRNTLGGQSCGAGPLPVWDYRERINDDEFSDYAHLNDAGRAEISDVLGLQIRDWVRVTK